MWKLFYFLLILSSITAKELPFSVSEKLVYTARFNIIPSGEASLEVLGNDTIHGKATYHARFSAKTNNTFDRLFKIRDKIDIWIGVDDLSTYQLMKKIREGNYQRRIQTTIYYQDSLAVINGDTIKISGLVRDPYSLFYYLRSIPLTIGQNLEFISFENKKTTPFQLTVTGKEIVHTEAGSFNCLMVKPFSRRKALLKNEGDMQIWFSDDERRLPVQIKIKLRFGSMLFKLKQFTG